jgi:hypothetical protein
MADICDDADKNSEALLAASIANARLKAAHVGHRYFEVCQFCDGPTENGMPYCDADCKDEHKRQLAITDRQFARSI